MSKIGKLPVIIPAGVTVNVAPALVTVKGAKGELKQNYNNLVKIEVKGNEVFVTQANDTQESNAAQGLYRNLIHNMVTEIGRASCRERV